MTAAAICRRGLVNIANMKVEPRVNGLIEASRMRGLSRLPLCRAESSGLVTTVAANAEMHQVDHRPEIWPSSNSPGTGCACRRLGHRVPAHAAVERGRFVVALRDDQPAELIAKLSGNFLPHRLAEEVAESDRAIGHGVRQENAPAVFGQPHVFEVRTGSVHADRRAYIHLMEALEPLRSHIAPPLDIQRLPMLERPAAAAYSDEGRRYSGSCLTRSWLLFQGRVQGPGLGSGLPKSDALADVPQNVRAPFSPTAFGR